MLKFICNKFNLFSDRKNCVANFISCLFLVIYSLVAISFTFLKSQLISAIHIKIKHKTSQFGLLLLCVSLPISMAQALMATTAKMINGNEPYITFDAGLTKVETIEPLLSIKLTDGTEINVENDVSSATQPIELDVGATFDSVETLVKFPTKGDNSYPTISLNSLIGDPFNYWGDDDGDGNVTVDGTLSVKWQTANNSDITQTVKNNPGGQLSPCDAPYKLTLTATDGKLSTQYGIPNTRNFKGNNHTYYIKVKEKPHTCYAQPGSLVTFGDELATQWMKDKGFKLQDINDPGKNFPTIGADSLFFKLSVTGLTAQEVISINGATVTADSGTGVKLKLSKENDDTGNVVRVTLDGPNKTSIDKHFSPSVFKLYSDNSKTQLLYSFKLERWLIPVRLSKDFFAFPLYFQLDDCDPMSAGYRVPIVSDYTNANDYPFWIRGIPGRWVNQSRREISWLRNNRWIGGFINEWGTIATYLPSFASTETALFATDADGVTRSSSENYVYAKQGKIAPLTIWTEQEWYLLNEGLDYPLPVKDTDVWVACITP